MISPADLPLNNRGAVYHLDLLPEELADFIITVGDPARVSQISQYFDSIDIERTHREFVTHTGYFKGKRISVISTGIGIPCIDIVMNELDALVNIDLKTRTPQEKTKTLTIIRLGTTGAFQENIRAGDILLSRYAIGFDTLMSFYPNQISPLLETMQTSLDNLLSDQKNSYYLTECCPILAEKFKNISIHGITATCGGFYAPQNRKLRIPLNYPNFMKTLAKFEFEGIPITNFEMETAGIYALGNIFGHRCLSLSVVIANRVTNDFITDVKPAVEKLIQEALTLIK